MTIRKPSDPTAGESARLANRSPRARRRLTDPTAGRTAASAHEHPEVGRPILDPTDPRYGELEPVDRRLRGRGTDAASADRTPDPDRDRAA
jgi:hypothetical protein